MAFLLPPLSSGGGSVGGEVIGVTGGGEVITGVTGGGEVIAGVFVARFCCWCGLPYLPIKLCTMGSNCL